MRCFVKISLMGISFFLSTSSSGQSVNNNNKQQDTNKPVRLKDTLVYKIMTQSKDTFNFGIDKKTKIKEADTILINTLKVNNKFLEIQFYNNETKVMTLSLEIIKERRDTSLVYSIS